MKKNLLLPQKNLKKSRKVSLSKFLENEIPTFCVLCAKISTYFEHLVFQSEPVKIISKKEQKRLEDEEFERVMAEMGVEGSAAAKATEESKQPESAASQAEIDEKKRLANQKKKQKKKAKQTAAAANQEEAKAEEMTEEQRQEAVQAAIQKRMGAKQ